MNTTGKAYGITSRQSQHLDLTSSKFCMSTPIPIQNDQLCDLQLISKEDNSCANPTTYFFFVKIRSVPNRTTPHNINHWCKVEEHVQILYKGIWKLTHHAKQFPCVVDLWGFTRYDVMHRALNIHFKLPTQKTKQHHNSHWWQHQDQLLFLAYDFRFAPKFQ